MYPKAVPISSSTSSLTFKGDGATPAALNVIEITDMTSNMTSLEASMSPELN
jgi:hypothetical protein